MFFNIGAIRDRAIRITVEYYRENIPESNRILMKLDFIYATLGGINI